MSLFKTAQLLTLATVGFLSINARSIVNAQNNDIESRVRESFEQQMKSQEVRIKKAEEDLKRIKIQFEKRMQNAEQIIKLHTELLARHGSATKEPDTDVPAALLSSEGWQAWQKQDWRTALVKFEAAVKKDPNAANTLNGLGWTYLHLGEYEKAIETFDKALEIEPTHLGVLNGVGQCLMGMGRNDEAAKKLTIATEAAIEQMGESTTVKNQATASWFGLVRALTKTGDYDLAIDWANRFLKHKPDDENMRSLLDEAKSHSPSESVERQ